MKIFLKLLSAVSAMIVLPSTLYSQNSIQGIVIDSLRAPIVGASVVVVGTQNGVSTGIDGRFTISHISNKPYTLQISMLSYVTRTIENVLPNKGDLTVELKNDNKMLSSSVVRGVRRMNSDIGVNTSIRDSKMIVNGISSRSIARSQDRDLGEVVKRIPGISIIDNKFIVSRGLSQRYNDVWINGASVPSSEADSRAFSFDIIPAGQIENILIVKSPVPELPADFSGGFVKINTKDTPEEHPFSITYSSGINSDTHFYDFKSNIVSPTEYLGFDGGKRMVKGGLSTPFDNNDAAKVTQMTKNGFNNDWAIRQRHPFPDQKLTASFGKSVITPDNAKLTIIGAINYSYTTVSYLNMDNSRFGVYNTREDKPEYLYKYTDNQYSTTVKAGALLNFAYIRQNSRYYFRNTFNQIGMNRLTERSGWQNLSSLYNQEKTEYNYSSRTTYCGQLSGIHDIDREHIEWSAGYSYANKNQPDRRIINRLDNTMLGDTYYGKMWVSQNDIDRSFIKLSENIGSLNVDWTHQFGKENKFRSGIFSNFSSRKYRNRAFDYRYNQSNLPSNFAYGDVVNDILVQDNYSADKLYIYDDTDNRDNYEGRDLCSAAYAAMEMTFGPWNLYAGGRFEYNWMRLTSYTRFYEWTKANRDYTNANFFPSINLTYDIDKNHKLRAAYALSVNRPEFREVSPSVYYDFDLFSDVKGNPNLNTAYIHNADLRYEWYPTSGETVSLALFYKNFRNPIETTFLDAGGDYTYTFENANRADAYGAELEIRKSLGFIGIPSLELSFNGSAINSKVKFPRGSAEHNRPLQGQSPYLINFGLNYKSSDGRVTCGILYNRIGKRIVGIGKSDISVGGSINNDIPNMYEMPRDVLDAVLGKKLSNVWEVKMTYRDILSQDEIFCQYPKYIDNSGNYVKRKQITKRFNAGSNIIFSLTAQF